MFFIQPNSRAHFTALFLVRTAFERRERGTDYSAVNTVRTDYSAVKMDSRAVGLDDFVL